MVESILLLVYGATVIASAFMTESMGALAIIEIRREGLRNAMRSTFFWLATNLAVQAIVLAWICAMRTIDGISGVSVAGTWGWSMAIAFGLLFITKVGFNWSATRELRYGNLVWRSFVSSVILWASFIATIVYLQP